MSSEFLPPPKQFKGWNEYKALIEEAYDDFSQQFLKKRPVFKDKPILVDFTENDNGKSRDFWHIVTRDVEHQGSREADLQRAVRAHWVLPMIENYQHPEVTYFAYPEGSGRIRHYFWHQSSNYLVILEEKANCFRLITAYVVDKKHMIDDLKRKQAKGIKTP